MVPCLFVCGKCLKKRYHLVYIEFSVTGSIPVQETVMQVSLYPQPSSPRFYDYLIISDFSFASF